MFKVLVAVDKSHYSSTVMKTVAKLAAHVESDITILTVVKPKRYRTLGAPGDDETDLAEFHQQLIHKYFPTNTLALGTRSDRDPKIVPTHGATLHSKIAEGDPADVICSVGETLNADLVVVGKRGERNVGSLLLGSVSEKVVHKSNQSVLVAKGETLDPQRKETPSYETQGMSRAVTN